jgi:hypothetical protein
MGERVGRRRLGAIAVASCVLAAGVIAGWLLWPSSYERLAEDDYFHYQQPVWASDGWIYLLVVGEDSEDVWQLARAKHGHKLEHKPVTFPGCPDDYPSVDALFPLSADRLGIMSRCGENRIPDRVVVTSYEVVTGRVTTLGRYLYDGAGKMTWRTNRVGYGTSRYCVDNGGIVELRAEQSPDCLVGHGSKDPVAAQDDVLYFAGRVCDATTVGPTGVAICRWHRVSNTFDVVATGFAAIDSFALDPRSGRLAISGQRAGQGCLWLADTTGQVRRLTGEHLTDPTFSLDGQHIAAVDETSGWFGHTSTIIVIPTPG